MADSSSSQQSQQSQPPAARSRASRGKKSLVHASIFSLRDLLSEFGQAFPNLLHLDAYHYPSKLTQKDVDIMTKLFGIKHPYRAVAQAQMTGLVTQNLVLLGFIRKPLMRVLGYHPQCLYIGCWLRPGCVQPNSSPMVGDLSTVLWSSVGNKTWSPV